MRYRGGEQAARHTGVTAKASHFRTGLQPAVCWLAVGPWSAWIRWMFLRAGRARAIGG